MKRTLFALAIGVVAYAATPSTTEALPLMPHQGITLSKDYVVDVRWRRCWRDGRGRLHCRSCWRDRWGRVHCR
jgi:hypothetical protein